MHIVLSLNLRVIDFYIFYAFRLLTNAFQDICLLMNNEPAHESKNKLPQPIALWCPCQKPQSSFFARRTDTDRFFSIITFTGKKGRKDDNIEMEQ